MTLEIISPKRHQQDLALQLLFPRHTPADRSLAAAGLATEIETGRLSNEGLFLALREQAPVGSILARRDAGRVVSLWPPGVLAGEPPETAVALVERTLAWARGHDVNLAQSLTDPGDEATQAALRGAGFEHATELLYLMLPHSDFPPRAPTGSLTLETYKESEHARMERLVESTYVGSHDCPQLDALRRTGDVLASYREIGAYSPHNWFFVREGDRNAGCLLLADHPQDDQLELVYVGLNPQDRGRGLGRQAVGQAIDQARRSGRLRLVLAVDAHNAPALRVYASLGFWQWAAKSIYMRPLT